MFFLLKHMFLSSKKYSPQWFLKYLGQWSAIVWTTQSTKKGIKSITLRQNSISQHNVQSIICCSMNSTRHFSHTFFSDEKVHHIYLSLHYARESIENLNVFYECSLGIQLLMDFDGYGPLVKRCDGFGFG